MQRVLPFVQLMTIADDSWPWSNFPTLCILVVDEAVDNQWCGRKLLLLRPRQHNDNMSCCFVFLDKCEEETFFRHRLDSCLKVNTDKRHPLSINIENKSNAEKNNERSTFVDCVHNHRNERIRYFYYYRQVMIGLIHDDCS